MSKPLTIQYTGKYANHLLREKEKEIERLNKDNGNITKLFAKEREKTKRLNNIIKRLENEISGAYTDLSNNLNVNYMHEAFKKDLLEILGDKENGR